MNWVLVRQNSLYHATGRADSAAIVNAKWIGAQRSPTIIQDPAWPYLSLTRAMSPAGSVSTPRMTDVVWRSLGCAIANAKGQLAVPTSCGTPDTMKCRSGLPSNEGTGMKDAGAMTRQQCSDMCSKTATCNGAAWQNTGAHCWLKTGFLFKTAKWRTDSGSKQFSYCYMAPPSGWISGGVSTQHARGDVELEFQCPRNSDEFVGLSSSGNTDNSYADIDCALRCAGGHLETWGSGRPSFTGKLGGVSTSWNSWDVDWKAATVTGTPVTGSAINAKLTAYEADIKDVATPTTPYIYVDGAHGQDFNRLQHYWSPKANGYGYWGQSTSQDASSPLGKGTTVNDASGHPPANKGTVSVLRFTPPRTGTYQVDLFGAKRKPTSTCGNDVDVSLHVGSELGDRVVCRSLLVSWHRSLNLNERGPFPDCASVLTDPQAHHEEQFAPHRLERRRQPCRETG